MKKKLKNKLILLFVAVAAVFALGGCSLKETKDEAIANRNLKAQVTYLSNGGTFSGTGSYADLYYPAGITPMNIGKDAVASGTLTVDYTGFEFDGWYYAVMEKNADGEMVPAFEDAEKGTYKLGEPVDFSQKLKEGDKLFFVAGWVTTVKIQIQLVCEEDQTAELPIDVKDGNGVKNYKHGDVLFSKSYSTSNDMSKPTDELFSIDGEGYTFVEYYADETCKNFVEWPLKKGQDQKEDAVIYAKCIPGKWSILKNADDVVSMFGNSTPTNYWLLKDISGNLESKIKAKASTDSSAFNHTLQGNGHMISDFLVFRPGQLKGGAKCSLFGTVMSMTKIENVTFKNLKMEYTMAGSGHIYFVFTEIQNGATVTDVTISGTLTITKPENQLISNIPFMNGEYNYKNCLFGGFSEDTAYSGGFNVEGVPAEFVTINNN